MNHYVWLHEEITQLTTCHCWDSIAIWRRLAVQVDLFIKAVFFQPPPRWEPVPAAMLPPVVCHLFSHTFTLSPPLVEKLSSPCGPSRVIRSVCWCSDVVHLCESAVLSLSIRNQNRRNPQDQVYVQFCRFGAPWKGCSSVPSVIVGLISSLFYEPKWKSLFKSDERKRMCPWQTPNELSITDGKNQRGDTLSRFFLTKYRQKDDMTLSHFYNINKEVCVSLCSPDSFCHIPRTRPHQRSTYLQSFHKETFLNNFVWMILWMLYKIWLKKKIWYYQMR